MHCRVCSSDGAPLPERFSSVSCGPPGICPTISAFAIAAISFSVLITWVYNHTGGSILLAILVHASINFSQGLTGDLFPAAKNNEVAPVIAFVALALVLVVVTRGRLGYTALEPAPVSGPAYSVP